MAHWDVSSEIRGEHGKWSKSGVIHKLAKEAEGAAKEAGDRASPGGLKAGHKVKYKTGAEGVVHHIDEKGVPHVVWNRGRGKPVRTPEHHLTSLEGEKKTTEKATEKAAREAASGAQQERTARSQRRLAGRLPNSERTPTGAPQERKPAFGPEIIKDPYTVKRLDTGHGGSVHTVHGKNDKYLGYIREGDGGPVAYSAAAGTTEFKGRHNNLGTARSRREAAQRIYNMEPRAQPRPGHARTGPPPTQHPMVPEPTTKTPGPAKSPDELRQMIKDMEAKEKARVEAENLRRHGPGGGTQIYSGQMGKGRNFGDVHQEYQKALAARERMTSGRVTPGPLALKSNQRQIDALQKEMRDMGARRKTGLLPAGTIDPWEMPPAPGSAAHKKEQINRELSSMTEQLHDMGAMGYTPESVADTRRDDIRRQLATGQKTIVIKVPSGSEIQISPETARYLLGVQQQAYVKNIRNVRR